MKSKIIIWIFFACLVTNLITPNLVVSGAWVQKKHGFYFKVSGHYFFTTKEFNHEGRQLDIFQERIIYEDTSFRDLNLTAYLEYGLLERFTLVANLPLKTLTSKRVEIIGGGALTRQVTTHTQGVSDLALSGRYALLDGSFMLSYQAGIEIPLGYEAAPGNDGPPLGTGNVDFVNHLLIGKSLFPFPAYLTGGVGYRWRSGAWHDQILFTAEGGYSFGSVLVKVTFDGLKSTVAPPDILGQPVTTPLPGGGGALPNIIQGDQDIFKISPTIIVNLTKQIALQGEFLHIYAGKNTVSGTIYSLGLIYTK